MSDHPTATIHLDYFPATDFTVSQLIDTSIPQVVIDYPTWRLLCDTFTPEQRQLLADSTCHHATITC